MPAADTADAVAAPIVPPAALSHDEFYAQLTARNRGLVPDQEQQRLRQATILVAARCSS
jgi:hypothetical protein